MHSICLMHDQMSSITSLVCPMKSCLPGLHRCCTIKLPPTFHTVICSTAPPALSGCLVEIALAFVTAIKTRFPQFDVALCMTEFSFS